MRSPGHQVTSSPVVYWFAGALVLWCSGALFVSCASAPAPRPGKPIEYYQTYNFSSPLADVRKAFHQVLDAQKYEIEKEDSLQIVAVNSEITSVEILTFAAEKTKIAQSVYSGEIRLTIDLLEAPQGGTLVSVKPRIQGVIGRTSVIKNKEWHGNNTTFTSRGNLENEMLKAVARILKEKEALSVLVSRGIQLEGGYTLSD